VHSSVWRKLVKDRYKKLGIWDDFVRIREEKKVSGLTPANAWRAAMDQVEKEFPDGKRKSRGPNADNPPQTRLMMDDFVEDEIVAHFMEKARGKDTTTDKMFRWVFNHVGIAWKDINQEDVPCPGAVELLKRIKKDPKSYQSFMRDFAKLLPNKAQLEAGERHIDDGKAVFTILERAHKEFSNEATSS
jgi:hypothetical protein